MKASISRFIQRARSYRLAVALACTFTAAVGVAWAQTRIDPSGASVNGSVIGNIYEAGEVEVNAAVAAAKAALKGDWGRLSVAERCKLLDAVAGEINRRFDDFLQAEIADTGKPHHLASHVDIPRGAANFQILIDTIKSTATESFNMRTPDGKTALSYGVRVPRGVIAVVCPWNLPLLLMTWKVGPALACGNRVSGSGSKPTSNASQVSGSFRSRREATSSSALPTPSWVTRRMPTDIPQT